MFDHIVKNISKDIVGNEKNIKINNLGVAQSKGNLDFYSYKHHKINSLIPVDKKTKFSKNILPTPVSFRWPAGKKSFFLLTPYYT